MNSVLKKFRFNVKYSILCTLILIAFFEWFEYSITPLLMWPKLFLSSSPKDSVKMLIVGDPQLLGYHYSPAGLFGYICRWDADRYVRKTFSLAYNYVNPDLVIFLGDNLDEGEIATDEEFLSYFKRFRSIFGQTDFNKAIIVPGDNDIGGENGPSDPEMEKRFNKYFRDDVFVQYQFLEFVKANYITHSNRYELAPNISESTFRIILSHVPLTPAYSTFVSRVIPYVKPHIILSSHDHKSQHVIADRRTGIIIQTPSVSDFNSYFFNISDIILHEIIVPTCSYRMGTQKMGYGVLEINNNGEASYVVLWLPSRFRQLIFLLFGLVYFVLFLIIHCSKFCIRRRSNNICYVNQYQPIRAFNDSGL